MEQHHEHGRAWEWFAARAKGPHAMFWLCALSFLQPIIIPIFPETLMGLMILADRAHWKKYTGITIFVSTLGGITGYLIGAFLFREFGTLVLGHWGIHQWFHTAQHMLAQNPFLIAVFLVISPIPDKILVVLSGFFHVPIIPFVIGFFVGRIVRFGAIGYLIYRFGEHMLDTIRRYFEVFGIAAVLVAVFFILHTFHLGGL